MAGIRTELEDAALAVRRDLRDISISRTDRSISRRTAVRARWNSDARSDINIGTGRAMR